MEEVEEDNAKDQFLKSVQMEWKMKVKRFELEIGDHNQDEKQELNDNIFGTLNIPRKPKTISSYRKRFKNKIPTKR